MTKINTSDIQAMEKVYRLNLINSITGIKPGNLIGSQNKQGQTNLAVFSSVIHLGSKPPIIGLIMRPAGEVARHTFENILATKNYTINHIPNSMCAAAHQTSAKYPEETSEFEACGFTEEYSPNFTAPFVKESKVKIGLSLEDIIPIKANNTSLIIGKVELIIIEDDLISNEGYIDLEAANSTGISGLNSYYQLKKIDEFPYART